MYQQQHQQPWMQPRPPQKNEGYKSLAIVLFVFGFLFHLIGLVPFIGIIFGLIGAAFDVCGFIFLCLI